MLLALRWTSAFRCSECFQNNPQKARTWEKKSTWQQKSTQRRLRPRPEEKPERLLLNRPSGFISKFHASRFPASLLSNAETPGLRGRTEPGGFSIRGARKGARPKKRQPITPEKASALLPPPSRVNDRWRSAGGPARQKPEF